MDKKSYLEIEKHGTSKQEYIAGSILDMPATDDIHFAVRMNFAFLLKEHLSGNTDCRIYMGDMKVHVESAQAFLYPDIFISCDQDDINLNDYKVAPKVLIEVLNGQSAAYDRGRKFSIYRQIPALQEYIVLETDRPAIDSFSCEDDGRWFLQSYGEADELSIRCLDFTCAVEDIYQDVFSS